MPCHSEASGEIVLSPLDTYFLEIDETKLLNAFEEQELAYRVQNGDLAARNHFVRANLRLVVKIARRYAGRNMALDDLIEEGNIGLIRAVKTFNPRRKLRFSTYARYWIEESISRALVNMSRTIRLPKYMTRRISSWYRTTARLRLDLGRDPTDEEVAGALQLSKRQLKLVRQALRAYNEEQRTAIEDPDRTLDDVLLDTGSEAPDTQVMKEDLLRHLLCLLNQLETGQARVLRMRYGLDGEEPMTLGMVSQALNLPRERARQLELRGLRELSTRLGEWSL